MQKQKPQRWATRDYHLKNGGTFGNSSANCVFSASTGDNGNLYQAGNNLDTTRTQNFLYDSLNRISQAYTTGPSWGETFGPTATSPGVQPTSAGIDPWGNLTERSGVTGKTSYEGLSCAPANSSNQLTSCLSYDSAGNVKQNGSTTYTYDDEGRLTATSGYTYLYDGDGKRVEKSSGSTGTLYWTGVASDSLAESDLSGNISAEYGFFNGQRVGRRDVPSNTAHLYLLDPLGTSRMVLTPTSETAVNVDEDADYYPYGGEIVVSGSTTATKYKFTGKERDAESGLDMFGARYYGSSLGRFMTPDWAAKPTAVPYAMFGNPQSLNLYSYVNNNPTTVRDPDGHCLEDACVLEVAFGAVALYTYTASPAGQQVIRNGVNAISGAISSLFQSSNNSTTAPAAGSQPKDVYVDPNKYPASAGHVADAQAAGHPDVLTVDRPGASDRRADATAGHATQPGTDRDEYPPAVTREGGTGASVQNIPSSDNRGSGASLGNQISDVPNGGQIRVIPQPPPPPPPPPQKTPESQ